MADEAMTPEQRYEFGVSLRDKEPLDSHAEWGPPEQDRDPVQLIEEQNDGRLEWLVPVRRARMSRSSFAFYRGSAETAPNPLWGNYEDLDSFSIWNFSVGLEKPRWGLRVYLDNAFDELGITGGQLEAGYLTYAYHFVQRPRTFGAQVRYKFK